MCTKMKWDINMLSFGEKGEMQQVFWCKIFKKAVNCGSRRIRESVKNHIYTRRKELFRFRLNTRGDTTNTNKKALSQLGILLQCHDKIFPFQCRVGKRSVWYGSPGWGFYQQHVTCQKDVTSACKKVCMYFSLIILHSCVCKQESMAADLVRENSLMSCMFLNNYHLILYNAPILPLLSWEL